MPSVEIGLFWRRLNSDATVSFSYTWSPVRGPFWFPSDPRLGALPDARTNWT